MTNFSGPAIKRVTIRAAACAAILGACASASAALPPFTLNPSAGGIAGAPAGSFTADNILVSDYSAVTFGTGTFADTGYLAISGFQLGGSIIVPAGLNTTYGMYIAFSGSGTTTTGNLTSTPTLGSFTSLTYTLYGYSGTGTFDFSGNTPTESTTGAQVALATGSLINGAVSTTPNGDGTFTPSANASLTFNVVDTPFFQAPATFYNTALTAFTNTTSEVEAFDGGFRIRQGGGSLNFASTVPEPSTYALMLAGIGVVGWVARRRRA